MHITASLKIYKETKTDKFKSLRKLGVGPKVYL